MVLVGGGGGAHMTGHVSHSLMQNKPSAGVMLADVPSVGLKRKNISMITSVVENNDHFELLYVRLLGGFML